MTRYGSVFVASDARITDITIQDAAVPEPTTWATTILGLGLAGAALRRRRRRQPALAAAA